MIRVLFFGPVAERIGLRQLDLPFREGLRWQDVRDEMQTRHGEAFAHVAIDELKTRVPIWKKEITSQPCLP